MPTVTATPFDALASCHDGRCAGYKQEKVQGIRTITEYSYFDLGGDIPGIERSTEMLHFADPEADERCPVCGEPRIIADQTRPIYPNISGVPQDALLRVGKDSERIADMLLDSAKREAEMAQMRALMERQALAMERQQHQIEALTGEVQSRPRGPGRPRKVEG